jgi:hypothetical protein
MKIRLALFAGITIAAATAVFAWPTEPPPPPPPPPPPEVHDCSPGFWKNHPETWTLQYCGGDALCVADLMADLTSRGPGSDALRHDAAGLLNSWADEYYDEKICTE